MYSQPESEKCTLTSALHWDYNCLLWRDKPTEPIVDYCMTRLAFGIASATCLATSSVLYLAEENDMELNLAARAVKESFYIDDSLPSTKRSKKLSCYISSFRSSSAKVDSSCINGTLNSTDILNLIPSEIHSSKSTMTLSNSDSFSKALGMEYSSHTDVLK